MLKEKALDLTLQKTNFGRGCHKTYYKMNE